MLTSTPKSDSQHPQKRERENERKRGRKEKKKENQQQWTFIIPGKKNPGLRTSLAKPTTSKFKKRAYLKKIRCTVRGRHQLPNSACPPLSLSDTGWGQGDITRLSESRQEAGWRLS